MIVCSCNMLDTDMIKECIDNQINPTPKSVLKELGWESDCSSCCDLLVKEIKYQINIKDQI